MKWKYSYKVLSVHQRSLSQAQESFLQRKQTLEKEHIYIVDTYQVSLAHTARFFSLATEIWSSVVSDEKEYLACLILKIVVSDKNLLNVFPHTASFRRQRQKSSSSATKIVLCALGFRVIKTIQTIMNNAFYS